MINKTKRNNSKTKNTKKNTKGGAGNTIPSSTPPPLSGRKINPNFLEAAKTEDIIVTSPGQTIQDCQAKVNYCPGKMEMTYNSWRMPTGRKCKGLAGNTIDLKSPEANQDAKPCPSNKICYKSNGDIISDFSKVNKSLTTTYTSKDLSKFQGQCYPSQPQQGDKCLIRKPNINSGRTSVTDSCGEDNYCQDGTCQPRINFKEICDINNKVTKKNNNNGICKEGYKCSTINSSNICIEKKGTLKNPCVGKDGTQGTCATNDLQCLNSQCEMKTITSYKKGINMFNSMVKKEIKRDPSKNKNTDYLVRQFEPIIEYLKTQNIDSNKNLEDFIKIFNIPELSSQYQKLYGIQVVTKTTKSSLTAGKKNKRNNKWLKYGGTMEKVDIIANIIKDNIRMLFYVLDIDNDNQVSPEEINTVVTLNNIKKQIKSENNIDNFNQLKLNLIRDVLYNYDNNPSVQLKKRLLENRLITLNDKQNPQDVTMIWKKFFANNILQLEELLGTEGNPYKIDIQEIQKYGANPQGLQKYLSQPFSINKYELDNLIKNYIKHDSPSETGLGGRNKKKKMKGGSYNIESVWNFININNNDQISENEFLVSMNLIDSITDSPTETVYVSCDKNLKINADQEPQNLINEYGKTITGTGIQLQEIALNKEELNSSGFWGEFSLNKRNNLNDPIHDLSAQVIIIRNSLKTPIIPPAETGEDGSKLTLTVNPLQTNQVGETSPTTVTPLETIQEREQSSTTLSSSKGKTEEKFLTSTAGKKKRKSKLTKKHKINKSKKLTKKM